MRDTVLIVHMNGGVNSKAMQVNKKESRAEIITNPIKRPRNPSPQSNNNACPSQKYSKYFFGLKKGGFDVGRVSAEELLQKDLLLLKLKNRKQGWTKAQQKNSPSQTGIIQLVENSKKTMKLQNEKVGVTNFHGNSQPPEPPGLINED